jgi:Flp pilus assembly pilin Flp
MKTFIHRLLCHTKLWSDRRGAAAIEYALVASLISIAIIVGVGNTGDKVGSKFNSVNAAME